MSKKPRFPPRPRIVLLALFPGFQILDAAGPIAAFEIAGGFARDAYRLRVGASCAGFVPSSAGVAMPAMALSAQRGVDTLIVAGGEGTREAMHDAKLIEALRRLAPRVRRVASVCSGAYLLAQAGLLDGKRATTHWRRAADLARRFPNVSVEADCIYIKEGKVWTSAGVSAGIDLALAMIADDLGADVAANVAREMVVYAKRPGGQAQHSALLDLDAARFAKLNAWMREHLHGDLSVDRLAQQAAMSPRNFARAYVAETGVTPAKAVERMRADAARSALEGGGSIQEIARRTGFVDPERMRRAFVRLYGAPPAEMRRTLRRA
ncbi:MAG TPA: GlxA family transcriptional regulator [Vitreimonas sp.]|nr:GlxA family transcriptional regulator [Vitreimonas sp.]